jgi:hypothetical protein
LSHTSTPPPSCSRENTRLRRPTTSRLGQQAPIAGHGAEFAVAHLGQHRIHHQPHAMAIERRQIPQSRQGLGCFVTVILMTRSSDTVRQEQPHFCSRSAAGANSQLREVHHG